MKRLILGLAVILSLGLAACGATNADNKPKASAAEKYKEIPASAISQTVDDMKTRDNIKDASFEVNGNKIKMKLAVKDISTSDQDKAQSYADSFLRTISNYVDDSQPTKDSYGKVYDGYYVNIVVEDANGMQVLEGDMLPGYIGVTWK